MWGRARRSHLCTADAQYILPLAAVLRFYLLRKQNNEHSEKWNEGEKRVHHPRWLGCLVAKEVSLIGRF